VELELQQFRYAVSLSYNVQGYVSRTYKDTVADRFK